MDIGKNIKHIRTAKKLSRKKLSELSGLSAGYIEEIESNKKTPTIESLLKISAVFQLTVSELIGETSIQFTPDFHELITDLESLPDEALEAVKAVVKIMKRVK